MAHGDKCKNLIDTSCIKQGAETKSKQHGFLASQKQSATTKSSSSMAKNQNSSQTNNWGPFKDRNDFVNMHFS